MSKKQILKYPAAYKADNTLYQPTHTVEFEDSTSVKSMTVERITFPIGFLVPGQARVVYKASDGAYYSFTFPFCGVSGRRFGDIFHAKNSFAKCLDQVSSASGDNVYIEVDFSKTFFRLRSVYLGPNIPELSIHVEGDSNPAFALFLTECFKLPYFPDKLVFAVSNDWYETSWYDPNGGVGEIYMAADIPPFHKKFSTSFDSIDLNKMIMSFPAPVTMAHTSVKDFPTDYHTDFDVKIYERKTFKSKDMLTPFSITFGSEQYIKEMDLYFYAEVSGMITEIYFPAPVYVVLHLVSLDAIEREEIISRLMI